MNTFANHLCDRLHAFGSPNRVNLAYCSKIRAHVGDALQMIICKAVILSP
ncbi:MAG TPA: hypothetical protein V6D33_07480 [Cyanophyceae cyanobacterium]